MRLRVGDVSASVDVAVRRVVFVCVTMFVLMRGIADARAFWNETNLCGMEEVREQTVIATVFYINV